MRARTPAGNDDPGRHAGDQDECADQHHQPIGPTLQDTGQHERGDHGSGAGRGQGHGNLDIAAAQSPRTRTTVLTITMAPAVETAMLMAINALKRGVWAKIRNPA